jgi:hypothetical protein
MAKRQVQVLLTAVTSTVLWDVTPCSPVDVREIRIGSLDYCGFRLRPPFCILRPRQQNLSETGSASVLWPVMRHRHDAYNPDVKSPVTIPGRVPRLIQVQSTLQIGSPVRVFKVPLEG